MEVVHEILYGLELFCSAQEDQENAIYESLLEGDCKIKASRMAFWLAYGEAAMFLMAVLTSWRKFLSMNEKLLSSR